MTKVSETEANQWSKWQLLEKNPHLDSFVGSFVCRLEDRKGAMVALRNS